MKKKKWKPYYNKAMQNEDEVFLKLVREKVSEANKPLIVRIKKKNTNIAEHFQNVIHPREVIKEAVTESSAALVLIHNHPSGEPQSSQDDIEITNRIISACELVGIKVLDHIIIGDNNYFSFYNEGLIEEEKTYA